MPKPIRYLVWAFQDFSKDNGPQWAAALSYYALMSAFPLMLAALSIAAMFIPVTEAVDRALSLSRAILPSGQEQIRATVEAIFAARGPATVISTLLLVWSGSQIFGVARQALNIAFDQDEQLSFIKKALFQLAMALTLGVLLLLALVSSGVIGLLWAVLGLGERLAAVRGALQYAVQGILLLVTFFLAYRFVPQEHVHSRAAWIGAGFATAAFLILRPAFAFYTNRFGNYSLVYGALATLIVLVLYAYLSATIFLLGGQVASLIEGIEHQGKTRDAIRQHHAARAPVRKVAKVL